MAFGDAGEGDVDEDGGGEAEAEAAEEEGECEEPVSGVVAVPEGGPQGELGGPDGERAGDQECPARLGGEGDAQAGGEDRAESRTALSAELRTLDGRLPPLLLLEAQYERARLDGELGWVRTVLDDLESGRLGWSPERLVPGDGDGLLPQPESGTERDAEEEAATEH